MATMQSERDEVERPTVAQLTAMGWKHVPGTDIGTLDADAPFLTEQLTTALRSINLRAADGLPWMDEKDDVRRAINALASVSLGEGVEKANLDTTDLLLSGLMLPGPSAAHGGSSATVQYIEWHEERADRNEFTVVDQLRVRNRSGEESVLDIVLFVNGIPLVAFECKRPDLVDPIHDAVVDLRHYAGSPLPDDDDRGGESAPLPAGVPELFRTVQLLVAATAETAHLGTITSTPDHFHPWRSVEPEEPATLTAELPDGVGKLNERHKLVGVVLRPDALLRVVRHYIVPMTVPTEAGGARTVKAVARHQQYRAAEKAVRKLLTGKTRGGAVLDDERGGVIWHTQGSGKSLTMTFLVRRMHLHHRLSEFMVVVVTDRTQLQRQLAETLRLSESEVETAKNAAQMEGLLRDGGRRVVFAMIQKYGTGGFTFAAEPEEDGDERNFAAEYEEAEKSRRERRAAKLPPVPNFPECNTSPDILVLVDEAHRSHTSLLHAALRKAIPNAAKIGFTGTPIMTGKAEDTRRIFHGGSGQKFLDEYRMADAENDGVVVRIRYEGRTGEGAVLDKEGLDRRFEDLIRDRDDEQKRELLNRWPSERDVAESKPMIRAKAEDMLEHWVTTVLASGGFKAQVAAVSRKAAVEYHHALRAARDALLAELADFRPEAVSGTPVEDMDRRTRYLFQAHRFRSLLRRIDFVPVVSPGAERKRREWLHWTDPVRQAAYIERFHQAFPTLRQDPDWVLATPFHSPVNEPKAPAATGGNPWSSVSVDQQDRPGAEPDPVHPDSPIAFLIVKSMLLTGFDAPREQSLYLDRPIRDAELLQAVARVNRPMRGKEIGYVVDYYGVFQHLEDALAEYKKADVDDTMLSMSAEVDSLEPAADSVRRYLRDHASVIDADLVDFAAVRNAALAFDDEAVRAGFDDVLHAFLTTLERVLPHERGLDYVAEARRWGLLQKRIRTLHRDTADGGFTMRRIGRKVRALIAEHLEGPEIDRVIAPVSLASPVFDERVRAMPPREAAAEMGHALRFHLEERVKREDPEKYTRLSERLEEILRDMPGRFDDQIREFGPLFDEVRRRSEEDPRFAGLTPLEQVVYRLLERDTEDNPGVDTSEADLRAVVGAVCDAAAETMTKASYQRQEQDVTLLAGRIEMVLLQGRVRPAGSDWGALRALAQGLAAHANANPGPFRARRRGE